MAGFPKSPPAEMTAESIRLAELQLPVGEWPMWTAPSDLGGTQLNLDWPEPRSRVRVKPCDAPTSRDRAAP